MITPRQLVFVGRNYTEHAREMGNDVPKEPLLFLKPPSSIIADGDAIVLHSISTHIEYEGEIAVIVGKRLQNASLEEARSAATQVVALNDVTARDLQKADGQWARAKGLDTFCPIGTPVAAPDDLSSIELITRVNGEVTQRARGSDMVFDIPTLLSFISRFITLQPGDIVATGTPAGTRKLNPGDEVEVELVGLSKVKNPVVAGA